VIAAPAIVVGILDAHQAARIDLHGLRPGRVSLNEDLVGARLSDRPLSYSGQSYDENKKSVHGISLVNYSTLYQTEVGCIE
jgi:hypothetical protein